MTSLFFGFIGGLLAWLATLALGQPVYRFVNLRRETARLLMLYEIDDHDKATDEKWLNERATAYRPARRGS